MKTTKLLVILFSLFLCIGGCCSFDKWTREDKILQGIQLGVHGIDWLQTKEIARNDDFHEANPHIGRNPTQRKVDQYMFGWAGFVCLVTHILPQDWRKYWLMFEIGTSAGRVKHNHDIGIRINIKH